MTGRIRVFGGNVPDFVPGRTGVTRLIETGTDAIVEPPVDVTVTVPVFAPGGRPVGFAVAATTGETAAENVPAVGFTLRNGLSVLALNADEAGPEIASGIATEVVLPNGTTVSAGPLTGCGGACTTTF